MAVDHGEGIFEFPNALSADLCAELIAAFDAEPNVRPGVVQRPDGSEAVDAELKRSTDYLIQPTAPPHWLALDQQLAQALNRNVEAYFATYPWIPKLATTFLGFQVQRTSIGDGFDWHADEDGRRRVAVIAYLNDDFEGGHTEFRYQKVAVAPRRGSMLLFPPYWTHVHRGAPVEKGTKYIVTSFLVHASN